MYGYPSYRQSQGLLGNFQNYGYTGNFIPLKSQPRSPKPRSSPTDSSPSLPPKESQEKPLPKEQPNKGTAPSLVSILKRVQPTQPSSSNPSPNSDQPQLTSLPQPISSELPVPPQPPPPPAVATIKSPPSRRERRPPPPKPQPLPPKVLEIKPSDLPDVDYAKVGEFVVQWHKEQSEANADVWPAWKDLYKQLQDLLAQHYGEGTRLHVFGSFMQNIARLGSDMDLSLVFSDDRKPTLSQPEQKDKIFELWNFLRGALGNKGEVILGARVPIVSFDHFDISMRFDGAINSHWVRDYVDANLELVQPLSNVLLTWIQVAEIKDNRYGYFSSYSITLMLLYYLLHDGYIQHRPIDHSPAALAPKNFEPFRDLQFADATKIDRQLVGKCLAGFFEFYMRRFPWQRVIQFQKPPSERPLMQEEKRWWSYLAIEDPFERDFNPARNVVEETWLVIHQRLQTAYNALTSDPPQPLFTLAVRKSVLPSLILSPKYELYLVAKDQGKEREFLRAAAFVLEGEPLSLLEYRRLLLEKQPELYNTIIEGGYMGDLLFFVRANPNVFVYKRGKVQLTPPAAQATGASHEVKAAPKATQVGLQMQNLSPGQVIVDVVSL